MHHPWEFGSDGVYMIWNETWLFIITQLCSHINYLQKIKEYEMDTVTWGCILAGGKVGNLITSIPKKNSEHAHNILKMAAAMHS